jgi:hypothetical protein
MTILGPEHPHTLASMTNQAYISGAMAGGGEAVAASDGNNKDSTGRTIASSGRPN